MPESMGGHLSWRGGRPCECATVAIQPPNQLRPADPFASKKYNYPDE